MNYLNIPWIIIGDFNAVVDLNKHKGGSHYYYVRKARIFLTLLIKNNHLDIGFISSNYTWCKNQIDLARH